MRPAPPLQTVGWINAAAPIELDRLRGRIVLIEAFQMLCPGCVRHGLPQAQRVAEAFPDLVVLGLHTVFEHHAVQGSLAALEAFAHEYRLRFPIGLDAPGEHGPTPRTMAAYAMEGTPTLILIDRAGRLRVQAFGQVDDLRLGAAIEALRLEPVVEGDAPRSEPIGAGERGARVGDGGGWDPAVVGAGGRGQDAATGTGAVVGSAGARAIEGCDDDGCAVPAAGVIKT